MTRCEGQECWGLSSLDGGVMESAESRYARRGLIMVRRKGRTRVLDLCISSLPSALEVYPGPASCLVNVDAQRFQFRLCQVDLEHELLVSVGNVVEGDEAKPETKQKNGAERNEGPEGEDRHDLFLDGGGQGDELEV